MNELQALNERLDRLETQLAFQDDTIDTLNATITDQWKQIDTLTRKLMALSERIDEAENNTGVRNEPPPHY